MTVYRANFSAGLSFIGTPSVEVNRPASPLPAPGFVSPPLTDLQVTDDQQAQGNFWGYMLEEDNALKAKLQGIVVSDLNEQQRKAQVWFHNPEKEQRGIRYPYITVEFTGQSIAHDREHRGWVSVGYKYLQDVPYGTSSVPLMEYPIPMNLDYTVITHTRNNQHHSQLVSVLNGPDFLHPRFAYLLCSGGTVRRLEVLASTPSIGLDKEEMRIFRMIYRLRVPTEVEPAVALGSRVKHVILTEIETVSGTRF